MAKEIGQALLNEARRVLLTELNNKKYSGSGEISIQSLSARSPGYDAQVLRDAALALSQEGITYFNPESNMHLEISDLLSLDPRQRSPPPFYRSQKIHPFTPNSTTQG